MVCLGNICRSPLAEGILRRMITENGLDWQVDSAGTESYHVGEAPHPLSRRVAKIHGIDISGLRARRLTREDFGKFDRLYALAPDLYREMEHIGGKNASMEKVDILLNEVHPGQDLAVPDPWSGPESGYQRAYELMEEACKKIISRYGDRVNQPS